MNSRRILVPLIIAMLVLVACSGGEGTSQAPAESEAPAQSGAPDGSEEPVAEDWPTQPVIFVAPGTVGGGGDTQARLAAATIEAEGLIDQPIAVLNKAPQEVYTFVIAQADDPHYLFTNANQLLTYPMTGQFTYDAFEDFIPVANLAFDPEVLLTRPDSPYQTLDDVIQAAQADPGSITVGGGQIGTQDHMALLTLQEAADIELNFVPFQGGAEIHRNVLGGQVDLAIGNPADFIASLESGELVGLAILDEERNPAPALQDIPTAIEQGVDAAFVVWRGWFFPSGVSDDIVQQASDLFAVVMDDPAFEENYLTRFGMRPNYLPHDEFEAYLREQEPIYEELLREAGVID